MYFDGQGTQKLPCGKILRGGEGGGGYRLAHGLVPAHVCLSRNEKADRAAKRGAKGVDSSTVTMKIGLADVYICGANQAGVEAVGEGVPPNGHGRRVGRYLSPVQGRSLLPWNADLPSSHHASSARGRLELHVRTDEV